uniref:protein-tyrosine-phosphatase n=1 Tax=Xiphophorus couchianus TaxID=32473 RepID=A0A3B5KYD1_9TELE
CGPLYESRLTGEGGKHAANIAGAGVGRTGVFITLSIVLERLRYEGVVDIFQTVKILQTQRPAMVQTEVLLSN